MLNKITTTIFAFILTVACAMAQAPTQINYQGVARDIAGNAIASQTIKVRFKVRNNASNGTIQYQETRSLTTSATGLFTVQIGSSGGTGIMGSMNAITWNTGTKYLQVEMDPTGGSTFTNMGAQLLVSVPYALQATKANSAQQSDSAAALNSTAVVKLSNLETTNASANQVLQFNGTSWLPTTLWDGLMLPYNANDPNSVSFAITNTSALGGSAIYGKTTTSSVTASGVKGESTGSSGNGVYGKSIALGAYGVLGENTGGIGVAGKSTNTHGVHGTTSSAGSAGVFGYSNHSLGAGVWGRSADGNGVNGEATGAGNGIKGTVTGPTGNGVYGIGNPVGCIGVYGISNDGTALKGYSNGGTGVFGSVLTGTALKGVSFSGYGLDVNGKVKIAGGNTNPGAGKVLTSDATGNATWQAVPKAGFKVGGTNTSFPSGVSTISAYTTEAFDIGNNYNTGTHKFTAPVTGAYHFSVHTYVGISSAIYNISSSSTILTKYSGGVETTIADEWGYSRSDATSSQATSQLNITVRLVAGDQVYVKCSQYNSGNLGTVALWSEPHRHYFSGHLVIAE